MPLNPGAPLRLSPRHLAVALLILALVAMGGVVRNQWVQDDTGVIRDNSLIHSLDGTWRAFGEPYWPVRGEFRELYRPLMIAMFTLQWAVGDGAPLVFRLMNLICYAGAIFAVWTLLRRIASEHGAWVGAALFAVHPVHVEAVAVSVNQSETIVAALLCGAAVLYLDWRQGRRSGRAAGAGVLALYLPALFIKEHALILPGLLLALELTVLVPQGTWRKHLRGIAALGGALFVIGALFWTLRGEILGPGPGTAPMETLVGLTLLGRAATMLGVTPEWLSLLLWPSHLQADWSIAEYAPFTAWSLRETLGAITVGSLVLALALSWRRRPRIALGLLWLGVAIAPVSNLVVPTGVLIAERTLFLASVAVAIVATDLVEAWQSIPRLSQGLPRAVAIGCLTATIGLGLVASATRMVTWRNRILFIASALADAPRSYRVWLSWGMTLHEHGDTLAGDSAIARSFALHPTGTLPFSSLAATLQWEGGHCRPAFSLYRELLARAPGRGDYRVGYIACATWLGYYDVAARATEEGIARRIDRGYLTAVLGVIDSSRRVGAPPGSVRLPPVPGGRNWAHIGSNPRAQTGLP